MIHPKINTRTINKMKINTVTRTKAVLYPTAIALLGGAALVSCSEEQRIVGKMIMEPKSQRVKPAGESMPTAEQKPQQAKGTP